MPVIRDRVVPVVRSVVVIGLVAITQEQRIVLALRSAESWRR